VWGVLPPGRGKRFEETPFTRVPDLVDALLREVTFTPPYLLFGHSLGGLLAFETARALEAAGRTGPQAVIVSAHRPPHRPHEDPPISGLAEDDFRAEVCLRYPPLPPELAEDPELAALSYRLLRSDLELVESYRYQPGAPLSCPLAVISGVDDYWSEQDLAGWRQHTCSTFQVTMVTGDHHYLLERADEVLKVIADLACAGPA
jgi:surfactin synthase thioesterase subunit